MPVVPAQASRIGGGLEFPRAPGPVQRGVDRGPAKGRRGPEAGLRRPRRHRGAHRSTRASARAATARSSSTASARTPSSPSSRCSTRPAHEFTAVSEERGTVALRRRRFRDPGRDRSHRRLAERAPHRPAPQPQRRRRIRRVDGRRRLRPTSTSSAPARSSRPPRARARLLAGRPMQVAEGDGLEVVGSRPASRSASSPRARCSTASAYRVRAPGSIAVSLCYVAASRFDGMITTRPCRSVDAAAAQLLVTEAGGTVEFGSPARLRDRTRPRLPLPRRGRANAG